MDDGTVKVELEISADRAKSQAVKAGQSIGQSVDSEAKSATAKTGSSIGSGISSSAVKSTSGIGFSIGSSISTSTAASTSGIGSSIGSRIASGITSTDWSGISTKFTALADELGAKASKLGTTMSLAITAPLVAAGAAAFSTAENFDTAMTQLSGALDDPTADMDSLRQLAIQTGQDTIYSANEAAAAMTELAYGGLTAADIQGGALTATMNLAAAGSMDLSDAANAVVQSMGAFNLSASDVNEAVNALAGGSAASSADVGDMTEALSQVSAQANSAGWTVQDATAAIAAMADAGVKGSDAGTSLKTMLQSIQAPTSAAQSALDGYGISVRDSSGNMISMTDLAGELQTKLGSLSSSQKDAALQTIFGSDASRAALILMNKGTSGMENYISATNDQTAAQRLADSQMGDTQKTMENMEGAVETAAISIGAYLAPAITNAASAVTGAVKAFSEMPTQFQEMVIGALALVAAIGPITSLAANMSKLNTVSRLVASALQLIGTNSKISIPSIKEQTSAIKLSSVAMGAAKVAAAGFALAGIALVASAINDAMTYMNNYTKATTGLKNAQSDAASAAKSMSSANNAASSSAQNASVDILGVYDSLKSMASSQAQAAESIKQTFQSADIANAQLEDYRDTIDDLAGKSNLSAAQQADLKTAVDGLNGALGTSYSVVDANNQIMDDSTGVILENKDAIYQLIQAKELQNQQDALSSASQTAYQEQSEAANNLTKAKQSQAAAEKNLSDAESMGVTDLSGYSEQLLIANAEVDQAQELYDAAAGKTSDYKDQINLLTQAQKKGTDSAAYYFSQNQDFVSDIEGAGYKVSDLASNLEAAGISATTLSDKGVTGASLLAAGYNGSTASMVSALSNLGISLDETQLKALGLDEVTIHDKTFIVDDKGTIVNQSGKVTGFDAKTIQDKHWQVNDDGTITTNSGRVIDLNAMTIDGKHYTVSDDGTISVEGANVEGLNEQNIDDKNFNVGANTKPAHSAIDDLVNWLNDLTSSVWTFFVGANASGGISAQASGGIVAHAAGGIIPMASGGTVAGIYTRPSILNLVGEAGDEAVIPLSNENYVHPFANAVASHIDTGASAIAAMAYRLDAMVDVLGSIKANTAEQGAVLYESEAAKAFLPQIKNYVRYGEM